MAERRSRVPAGARGSTAPQDPLQLSLEELVLRADELVDQLPIEAPAPAKAARPRPGPDPADESLRETLEQLDDLVAATCAARPAAPVQVAGDRGEDIDAHLSLLLGDDAPPAKTESVGALEGVDEAVAVEAAECAPEPTLDVVTEEIVPEAAAAVVVAESRLPSPAPIPAEHRSSAPAPRPAMPHPPPDPLLERPAKAAKGGKVARRETRRAGRSSDRAAARAEARALEIPLVVERPARRGVGGSGWWVAIGIVLVVIGATAVWYATSPVPRGIRQGAPSVPTETDATERESLAERGPDESNLSNPAEELAAPEPQEPVPSATTSRKPATPGPAPVRRAAEPLEAAEPATVSRAFSPPPPPADPEPIRAPVDLDAATDGLATVEQELPPTIRLGVLDSPSASRPAEAEEEDPSALTVLVAGSGTVPQPSRGEPAGENPLPDWSLVPPAPPSGKSLPGRNEGTKSRPTYRGAVAVDRIAPAVPDRLAKRAAGGKVVLQVLVDEAGRVVRVVVDTSTTGADLEAAAIEAVLRWRYRPAEQDGTPIREWVVETFEF